MEPWSTRGLGSVAWIVYWFEVKVTLAPGARSQPTAGLIGPVQSPETVPLVEVIGRRVNVWFPAVAKTVSCAARTRIVSSDGSLLARVIAHSFMWPAPALVQMPKPVHELGSAQSWLLLQEVLGETHVLKMLTPCCCAFDSAGKARTRPTTRAPEPRNRRTVAEPRIRFRIFFSECWELLGL